MRKGMLAAVIVVVVASVALAEIGEPILIGKGHDPQWSPDETHIAFLQGDNLMVKRLDSPEEAQHLYTGPILRYYWLDDSTLATYERRMGLIEGGHLKVTKLARIRLRGEAETLAYDSVDITKSSDRNLRLERYANGAVAYFDDDLRARDGQLLTSASAPDTSQSKPNLSVGTEPLGWGKVWLYYGSPSVSRQVTLSENHYNLPRLAPTQDRLFCWAARGDLVVFDTLGVEVANLGPADMARWGPDGRYIVYCLTTYGHYDLESSDIWITQYDGSGTRQITETPEIIEYEPSFSPSGRHIIYRAYDTGELLIVGLNSAAAAAEK